MNHDERHQQELEEQQQMMEEEERREYVRQQVEQQERDLERINQAEEIATAWVIRQLHDEAHPLDDVPPHIKTKRDRLYNRLVALTDADYKSIRVRDLDALAHLRNECPFEDGKLLRCNYCGDVKYRGTLISPSACLNPDCTGIHTASTRRCGICNQPRWDCSC